MNDRILESYLKDFSEEYELTGSEQSDIFEHFVNYNLISRVHAGSFDLDDVIVGGANDAGIDGIAMILNDHLVTSKDEIDDYVKLLGRVDVQFIFIQSKTSKKFNSGGLSNFLFGVEEFFKENPAIPINEHIQELRELHDYIYKYGTKIQKNPRCDLFYVTTGKWLEDNDLQGKINISIDRLKDTNLFSEVTFYPIDLKKLKSIYKTLKYKVEKQINFANNTYLPDIEGVDEAYIGTLSCEEYFKLICDEDGIMQRSLFYDNVRDYQGNNSVNLEIIDTLNNDTDQDKFVLLNNGITIVAKEIPNKRSSLFTISDYQIVNGCQTSHILYYNRENLSKNIYLPIKLIVTKDQDVTNKIIRATNRQTEVKVEAFEALKNFHKGLEEFYTTFNDDENRQLFYERRSKQYEDKNIRKRKIISVGNQIRCFVAMFLNEPHSIHRYYGELLKAYHGRLFQDDHNFSPYYTSVYAHYLLDTFFRTKKIGTKYKKFKPHLLMLFRINIGGEKVPKLSGKDIEKYCGIINTVLWDKEKSLKKFKELTKIIDSALNKSRYSWAESARRKLFTNEIISISTKVAVSPEAEDQEEVLKDGTVGWFRSDRGFGVIVDDDGIEFFVHYSSICGTGFRTLSDGQKVQFEPYVSQKGRQAHNVHVTTTS